MRRVYALTLVVVVSLVVLISYTDVRAQLYLPASDPGTNSAKSDAACTQQPGGDRNPILTSGNYSGPKVGCTGSGEPWFENILKLVFGLMSVLSLIFVAIGAFKYTTSGGSGDAIASAKKTIIYALLGLLLGVSAFTISSIVLGALS